MLPRSQVLSLSGRCRNLGRCWLQNHTVLSGEFSKPSLLGLLNLVFVLLDPVLDIGQAVNHGPPEHLGQFACECQVSYQSSPPGPETTVKASQGLIRRAANRSGDQAEDAPSPITGAFLTASALSTFPAAAGARIPPTP